MDAAASLNLLNRAPASSVAPLQYVQLLWAIAFGAIFYAEFPDFVGVLGLITGGVAYPARGSMVMALALATGRPCARSR